MRQKSLTSITLPEGFRRFLSALWNSGVQSRSPGHYICARFFAGRLGRPLSGFAVIATFPSKSRKQSATGNTYVTRRIVCSHAGSFG
jgi:hypothetical protein